jgi:hypothetical protein
LWLIFLKYWITMNKDRSRREESSIKTSTHASAQRVIYITLTRLRKDSTGGNRRLF